MSVLKIHTTGLVLLRATLPEVAERALGKSGMLPQEIYDRE